MTMLRTTTWNNLGVVSNETSKHNLGALLQQADLDYNTVARDLYVDAGNGTQILVPDRKMILREDTNELFGIVSDRYQICQNRDALDFVQYIDEITLQRAGSMGGYVYLIANMPEMRVLDDVITPNIIFQNSHDGSCSIKATICMLRMVCQNQFVRTFKESPATIRISHMGDIAAKMTLAQDTFRSIHNYIVNFKSEAEELASQKITPTTFNKLLEKFFSTEEHYSKRRNEKVTYDLDNFVQAYNAEDNQNFVGTKWGLVNAYSDYLTHREPMRKSDNYEFNNFYRSLSNSRMDDFIEYLQAA